MIKQMKFEEDTDLYLNRAEKIVDIYNSCSSTFMSEELDLNNPSNTLIIYSDEDAGGLLMDYHKEYDAYRLMFAAFQESNRGKGLLRSCMNFSIINSIDIAFIEVSMFSKNPIWRHLGYTIEGIFNFCPFLANRELE